VSDPKHSSIALASDDKTGDPKEGAIPWSSPHTSQ
jgi:hypothetical protein